MPVRCIIRPKRVGPEAEKHAVPERDHAGISHQKIERGGEQAIAAKPDHEIEQRLAAGKRQRHQEHKHNEGQDGADDDFECQR